VINTMDNESKTPDEVKFKYIFPDDYNPRYVSGAHGGINPQGEIIVNFYFERIPVPYSQTHKFDIKTGVVGELIDVTPSKDDLLLIRYIESGIIMNVSVAKKINAFLEEKIEVFEALETIDKTQEEGSNDLEE